MGLSGPTFIIFVELEKFTFGLQGNYITCKRPADSEVNRTTSVEIGLERLVSKMLRNLTLCL